MKGVILMRSHNLPPRSRIVFALGNVCLYSGVMIALMATEFARQHHAVYSGLLFGLPSLAICLNFWAMRSARCGVKGRV